MISLNLSSSSFVIRYYLVHPYPSLFLYGLLWSLCCFSILVNYYFQVSFNLKVILVDLYLAKKTQIPWVSCFKPVALRCNGKTKQMKAVLDARVYVYFLFKLWWRLKKVVLLTQDHIIFCTNYILQSENAANIFVENISTFTIYTWPYTQTLYTHYFNYIKKLMHVSIR